MYEGHKQPDIVIFEVIIDARLFVEILKSVRLFFIQNAFHHHNASDSGKLFN